MTESAAQAQDLMNTVGVYVTEPKNNDITVTGSV